jgi:hypothetical protein
MADSVTLAWEPGSIPDLAGYRLYSGTTRGTFTQEIEVGNSTAISVSNLREGQTYFFAVAAYNTSGAESAPSDEVSYTVPFPVTAAAPAQASAARTTVIPAPAAAIPAWASTLGPPPRAMRLLKRGDGMDARQSLGGSSIEAAAYARWCSGP